MSTAPMLSSSGQQDVLSEAAAQEKANLQKMKRNTAAATASFAGAAVLFAVCPPAGLGFVAASLTAGLGTVFAGKVAGNVLTHKNLEHIRQNLAHPAVLAQMQKRARKLYKFAARAGMVSNIGAFVALGALVGAFLAPSLALPILYNLGMAAFGGGALAAVTVSDAKKTAAEMSSFALDHSVTPPPPANEDRAPPPAASAPSKGLSRMPSLTAAFGASLSAKAAHLAPANDGRKPVLSHFYP